MKGMRVGMPACVCEATSEVMHQYIRPSWLAYGCPEVLSAVVGN